MIFKDAGGYLDGSSSSCVRLENHYGQRENASSYMAAAALEGLARMKTEDAEPLLQLRASAHCVSSSVCVVLARIH